MDNSATELQKQFLNLTVGVYVNFLMSKMTFSHFVVLFSLQLKGKSGPKTVAEMPEHRKLNRFSDVVAADDTRVVLLPRKEAQHDYINASFIRGPNGQHNHIAAQGYVAGKGRRGGVTLHSPKVFFTL